MRRGSIDRISEPGHQDAHPGSREVGAAGFELVVRSGKVVSAAVQVCQLQGSKLISRALYTSRESDHSSHLHKGVTQNMNSFKRKALTCAVLAGLGGVATTAEAVYLNPDGTGQVLVYPYYTVNSSGGNAFNTYISVTNTTSQAKVTKVRFREGRTSAEVLDFNLYLSPNDVWVGAIGPDTAAADSAGRLFGNFEASCTYPAIPAGGQPFTNIAYIAGIDALPGTGLDRTREGYVEIFDMATL